MDHDNYTVFSVWQSVVLLSRDLLFSHHNQ